MTTTAVFADAINRLDDGTATPADREAADVFDRHASAYWHRVNTQVDGWQADRCVICGVDGEGQECGSCTADRDYMVARSADA